MGRIGLTDDLHIRHLPEDPVSRRASALSERQNLPAGGSIPQRLRETPCDSLRPPAAPGAVLLRPERPRLKIAAVRAHHHLEFPRIIHVFELRIVVFQILGRQREGHLPAFARLQRYAPHPPSLRRMRPDSREV